MNTQPTHPPHFADPSQVAARLAETGYLADDDISTIVFLADRLSKPLLVEGPIRRRCQLAIDRSYPR